MAEGGGVDLQGGGPRVGGGVELQGGGAKVDGGVVELRG